MSGVTTIVVAPDEGDLRLDRWFARHFPGLGHGHLQKLLRTGQVRVDGSRAKANERLSPGQAIRIPPLPTESEKGSKPPRPAVDPKQAALLKARVLHRDGQVIAIDKPAGLAVQGGTGQASHVDAALDALRFDSSERPRLVHRLDKDTSGVLLLARSASAAAKLTAAFKKGEVEKIYWAVVVGVPTPREGRLSAPVAKVAGPGGERMMAEVDDGKPAVTDYRVLDSAGRHAALVELRPRTGRTHQLRVHCALLGTPILGDGKYGAAGAFIEGMDLPRQLHLHARELTYPHPDKGTGHVTAPLPEHFRRTVKELGLEVALESGPSRRREG